LKIAFEALLPMERMAVICSRVQVSWVMDLLQGQLGAVVRA
jgi:hypothetical protein